MYPTTHGHTGVIITTTTTALAFKFDLPIWLAISIGLGIGTLLSFVSHFVWDYLGEYDYGSTQKLIRVQMTSVIIFIICTASLLFANKFVFVASFIIGYIAGNSPDIIDKKIGYFKHARKLIKRFSCHGGNGFLSIGNWKFGKMLYPVTKKQNIAIQIVMTVALIFLTIKLI